LEPVNNFQSTPTFGVGPTASFVYETAFDFASAMATSPYGFALNSDYWPEGTDPNERVGRSMYLKAATGMVSVQMENYAMNVDATANKAVTPIKFRVLIFKRRRQNDPSGQISNPYKDLFLATDGSTYGSNSGVLAQTMKPFDFSAAPVNGKRYAVKRDFQFSLQNAVVSQTNTVGAPGGLERTNEFASKYPSRKDFKFSLGTWKKTTFNSATDTPNDTDCHWMMAIYGVPHNGESYANPWDVSIRGSSTATDL